MEPFLRWAVDNKLRFVIEDSGGGTYELVARKGSTASRIPLQLSDELASTLAHLADCVKTGVEYHVRSV
jgi:hypothetical protein